MYKNNNFGANAVKLVYRDDQGPTLTTGNKVFQGAYNTQSNYTNNSRE
jgi:hypothetical protein